MFTIDEIRIEGDEDGFHLTIYLDGYPDESVHYRIGLPDQFRAEVERTIGAWLAEGEAVWTSQPRDGWEHRTRADGTTYAVTDPKHPDYHDTMSGIHDNREGK